LTPCGFLYNISTHTYTGSLSDPLGTNGTFPLSICGNNVVGYYIDSTNVVHGFLYDGSAYTTLDDPLAASRSYPDGTYANGISGNNIVGWYSDQIGERHGFIFNGSSYTTIDEPLAGNNHKYLDQGTIIYGISDNNLVGAYVDTTDCRHGFVYNMQTGSFTTMDDPLATSPLGTIADGICGKYIAGIYYDSSAMGIHGFLFDGSTYTTIDDPNATRGSWIEDISGNNLVGSYCDGSGYHGFIATIPEPSIFALLGIGAASLFAYAWRRQKRTA
jgi:hypothetical protein